MAIAALLCACTSANVTHPALPAALAYIPQGSGPLIVANSSGEISKTFPIAATYVALDDAGNLYDLFSPAGSAPRLQMYRLPSLAPARLYSPGGNPLYLFAASSGDVVEYSAMQADPGSPLMGVVFEWAPHGSGAPSLVLQAGTDLAMAMARDGTLYIPKRNPQRQLAYSVFAPGSLQPVRSISESIVPPGEQSTFSPNYMAVGGDGTLYVTEYNYVQPDRLAGLYVYRPDGTERFIKTSADAHGAGPQGVAADAFGNVIVANNNAGWLAANQQTTQSDTLHDIEIFPAGGFAPVHITGAFDPNSLAPGTDGSIFFSSYSAVPNTIGVNGTYAIPPGASTPIRITVFPSFGFALGTSSAAAALIQNRTLMSRMRSYLKKK